MSQHPTCSRCGRTLRTVRATTPTGEPLGPKCARRDRAERAASAVQVDKAREVLELGAIAATDVRTGRGRRVFVVVPSSGVGRYFTTVTACTCPAGLKGRRCYHSLAARLAA